MCVAVIELAHSSPTDDVRSEMRTIRSRLSCWARAAEQRLAVFGVDVQEARQSADAAADAPVVVKHEDASRPGGPDCGSGLFRPPEFGLKMWWVSQLH